MSTANLLPRPWWTYGMVWMVISGPAVVVVAGFVTMYLAFSGADPVLPTGSQVKAVTTAVPQAEAPSPSLAPALQGRNHAATGVVPRKP